MTQKTLQYLKTKKENILVAAMFAVYMLIVIIFHPSAGDLIFIGNALPALTAAILFGQRKAMIIYAFCLPTDLLLHQIITTQHFYSPRTLIGIGIAAVVVLLLGQAHDMAAKIQELQTALAQSGRLDPLTNLLNRGTLLEFAEQVFKQTAREHFAYYEAKTKKTVPEGFSVVLISIDRFKELNGAYGHTTGDEILRTMGDVLSSFGLLRGADLKGRYGGDKFLLILPHTVSKHAVIPLKKLGKEFKSIQFISEENRNFTATFSCGISQYDRRDRGLEDILKRTEEALASAKDKGADRIMVYENIAQQKSETTTALQVK